MKATNPYAAANAPADIVSRRAYAGWTSGGHTGNDVPVMAYGPYAEEFARHLDNTDLYKLMSKAYGFQK